MERRSGPWFVHQLDTEDAGAALDLLGQCRQRRAEMVEDAIAVVPHLIPATVHAGHQVVEREAGVRFPGGRARTQRPFRKSVAAPDLRQSVLVIVEQRVDALGRKGIDHSDETFEVGGVDDAAGGHQSGEAHTQAHGVESVPGEQCRVLVGHGEAVAGLDIRSLLVDIVDSVQQHLAALRVDEITTLGLNLTERRRGGLPRSRDQHRTPDCGDGGADRALPGTRPYRGHRPHHHCSHWLPRSGGRQQA
ncbi:hypothetical protein NONI108955_44810 [Nocardia ninae]